MRIGLWRSIVVLSPTWYEWLLPHAHKTPSCVIAAIVNPAAIVIASVLISPTKTGGGSGVGVAGVGVGVASGGSGVGVVAGGVAVGVGIAIVGGVVGASVSCAVVPLPHAVINMTAKKTITKNNNIIFFIVII